MADAGDKPPLSVPRLWDEHSTEDESSKATRLIDAEPLYEELMAMSKRPASEKTPALGESYVAVLLEAPAIEVHDGVLTDEERAAVEADEA